ncbi:MAG: MBL fold metallo-hydrolase [Gammaproteobacteria bacterium]
MMEFAVAGSGSRGNSSLIRNGSTLIMVDCGFSFTETQRRLARLEVEVEALDAILVTHEHGDHVAGVARLAARAHVPVWTSAGTGRAGTTRRLFTATNTFDSHASFAIGDIEVTPLIVPHDAAEPTQFLFGDGAKRMAVVTDLGHVTPFITQALGGLDALLLESNHDDEMLASGFYPNALKKRVGGAYGHLSNAQTAELLHALDTTRLHTLALAHLSAQNNTPELARASATTALGCEADWVRIADQDEGLPWVCL